MLATIRIWSEIGHTPLTNRNGSFCDELVCINMNAQNREEAIEKCKELLKQTPHAKRGHVDTPEHWNHNERSTWL